ncbi:MAG: hypothetical protein NT108_02600 [Candidatus Kaiserbacteria bacterium]|nr:hypothetical protein [Candidatus Kaiserbacteria bacterium]
MKISRTDLQKYFETALPSTAAIADAFTFHCFEIEEVDGDTLDIKVLTNRAADCNSEAGIAAELSAILDMPLKSNPVSSFSDKVVEVSLSRINAILGADFLEADVEDVFRRLRFHTEKRGDGYRVAAPLPRTDIEIPEDVAEEVGRILGYDRIPEIELPPISGTPDQARFRGIEKMKDQLVEQGFIEVSTQSFAKQGDIFLANPLDKTKPALRTSLEENLQSALERAKQYAPLVLPPKVSVKLFEVGTVFPKEGEYLELRMTERVKEWGDAAGISDNLSVAKLEEYGKDYIPKRYTLGAYKPFSVYPFITRDIALWVPSGTEVSTIESVIRENAGELLARLDQFDQFEKEGRVSYAFRLVFQSRERTLTDDEVNDIMEKISAALRAALFEVR